MKTHQNGVYKTLYKVIQVHRYNIENQANKKVQVTVSLNSENCSGTTFGTSAEGNSVSNICADSFIIKCQFSLLICRHTSD